MSYRLVICIDVDADSLEQAYGRVYEGMNEVGFQGFVGWQSTEENFDSNGEPIPDDVMTKACDAFFNRKPTKS